MSGVGEQPLGDAEVDALFVPCLGVADSPSTLVLAVSGGVDSMALMHLAAEAVRRAGRGRILVATVDHRLRTESAAEAAFVAAEAQRIGLAHTTLVWAGEKPATGVQEAARAARYGLLAGVFHVEQARWLVTAHTADDQAETVLLRLARGSGLEGLSGIAPIEALDIDGDRLRLPPVPAGLRRTKRSVAVARPLLGVSKSRLVATMRSRGLAWIEDPSNLNPAFERVRIRRAMPLLAELGLTSDALCRSARRLRTVREGITRLTLRALDDPSLVRVDPLGYVAIDRRAWSTGSDGLGEALQLRLLAAVIRMVGGSERPLSLASLEEVARRVALGWSREPGPAFTTTIGYTRIELGKEGLVVVRETGRRPPAPILLQPGQGAIWDNRFFVNVGQQAPAALEVRALGEEGAAALEMAGHVPVSLRRGALASAPAFYQDGRLVAVPSLAEHWRGLGANLAAPHLTALVGPCVATFQDMRTFDAVTVDD